MHDATHPARVAVIDDDHAIRFVLARALDQPDLEVSCFEDGESALATLLQAPPDVVVTDIRMPGMDGLAFMTRLHQACADLPVIVMTAHSDLDSAVASYQGGAFEYLPKPFDLDEALALVRRAVAHGREQGTPAPLPRPEQGGIIGESPAMQEVFRAIGRLSRSPVNVLIRGASGTGKERIARALHQHSPRAGGPFIALNMAAIPAELVESELFGHEKGAFTGAEARRAGRFEQAHGGTLLLDEIGDMPADTQTRLLRVLADGEFFRVGGHAPVRVDVRILAATHQPLESLVEQGRFREDLFHRLNVIAIALPDLEQRREDIPRLARHFLQAAAVELGTETRVLTPEVEALLCRQAWPGNVRQLENLCRWLTVMASGREILPEDLPDSLDHAGSHGRAAPTAWQRSLAAEAEAWLTRGDDHTLEGFLPEAEAVLMEVALAHCHGRKGDAAAVLGWGRNTLTRRLNAARQAGSRE